MDRGINSNTSPAQGAVKRMSKRSTNGGRLTPPSRRLTPSPSPSPSQPQRHRPGSPLTHHSRLPRTSQSSLHHAQTPRPSSRSSVQRSFQNTGQGDKHTDRPRRRDSDKDIETARQTRQGEAHSSAALISTSPSPPSLTTSHSNSVSPPVRTPPGSGHRSGFGPRSAFGVVNNSQRQSHKQPQKSPSVNKGHRGRTRRDTESDALESDGDGDKTVTEVIMTPRPVLGQQQTRRRPQYPMLGVTSPHLNSSLDLSADGTARSRTPNVPGGETRVPLHRRGTSRTYERLEDLLREAGYKEVRVFTPEGVRGSSSTASIGNDGGDSAAGKEKTAGGAFNAVVGLLRGLVGRGGSAVSASGHIKTANTSTHQSDIEDNIVYEPPASPLAGRTRDHQGLKHDHGSRTMAPPALPLPDPSVPGFVGEADGFSYAPSFRRGTVYEDQDATIRASRAGAYLRHVTSAPHMRGATVVGGSRRMRKNRNVGRGLFVLNDGSEEEDGVDGSGKGKQGVRGNGEGEDEPRIAGREKTGWLGFVTRAVGGTGTSSSGAMHPQFHLPSHRGGPGIQDGRTGVSYARAGLRQTRSSLSQVSLVSRRSVGGKYLAPPKLVIHAGGSVGPEVTRARVVCRSAPGSREGSPERKRDRTASQLKKGKGRVPSLARTSTSVDGEGQLMWDQVADRNKAAVEEDADIGSEEDGEVTLAKILVPPKRQNSIRSLRKHLPPALGIAYLPQGEVAARRHSNKEPEEEEWVQWGQGWHDEEEGAKSRKRLPKWSAM